MSPIFTASLLLLGMASVSEASIQASVTGAIPLDNTQVGVGSTLNLDFGDGSGLHPGVFLGKYDQPGGVVTNYMVFDATDATVYLTNATDVTFDNNSLEPVLMLYTQVDGTCTGYAMDNLMQQMELSGFVGNGSLGTALSTEEGRTQLLVSTIDAYYLATQHKNSIEGILTNDFGKQYGFSCPKKMFQDTASAIAFVNEKMSTGTPLLISFNIGQNMVNSDIVLKNYDTGVVDDSRLWTPRQIGDRVSGGHSVVAVGEFQYNGKTRLLMLDSDWTYPRIWDLDDYLGGKVAISEIEFYACDGTATAQ